MSLLEAFERHLTTLQLDGTSALVAVSGGPDSLALLDLLAQSRERHGLRLVVGHVDHGIHPESGRVAEAVQAVAARYDLPVEVGHLALGASTSETSARAARYAWLEATRRRVGADLLFIAHHADDQVETVLMRVLRGSGPAGLAAMAPRRGVIVRPLLPFRRADLAAHVAATGLRAWLDPANADSRHLRSWLRSDLIPKLRERLPDIDRNLTLLASQAARDRAAWEAILGRLLELDCRAEYDGVSMSAEYLSTVEPALAETLVLAAARRVGCQLGPSRLARVVALFRAGESGSSAPLGGHWRAEVSFGRLYLVAVDVEHPGQASAIAAPWRLEGPAGEGRWGQWRFRWHHEPAPVRQARQSSSAWFAAGPVVVRARSDGEYLRPLAGTGRRPVVQCLQEAHVPRWRRAGWPVVTDEAGGKLLWIPGICRSDVLVPVPGADALRIDAERVEQPPGES